MINLILLISIVILIAALCYDIYRSHNNTGKTISLSESLKATVAWVVIAAVFGIGLIIFSPNEGMQFLTVYTLEKLLSFDNLFVFSLIFALFKVPKESRYKVLHYGILGAIILRLLFITLGVGLVVLFKPALILMGLWVLYTVYQMYQIDDETEISENKICKLFRKLFPVTKEYHGNKFFALNSATPLFIALIMVETSDVMFALDSVPAAFGVTQNVLIILLANLFAILGLRSLYFALEAVADKFESIKHGIAVILAFIGTKMILSLWIHIPDIITLVTIITILIGTLVVSVITTRKGENT